ncbi:protein of unknown function [Oceanobacillus limi]|uniref:Transcobalamin-like C-terminal domain-containing protein n=1 Tax=Oceanobacillus limi TaxID=930131 RepID=A0A1H9ZIB5_9BACI|nr:DUF4430 domain-containing protein [Oceanobacillus limi]SES81336.1 protein of unknown function [Oceanobacillus limi]
MKRFFMQFFTLLLVVGIVTGCGSDTPKQEESSNNTNQNSSNSAEVEEAITIVISTDEGEEVISNESIAIEEGDILMDVMKENYDIEEEGGFIHSIDGIAPEEGEEKAWMYFVNDEMASVGADEYELTPGEEINFDLQAW